MPCSHGVEGFDERRVRHGDIGDVLQEAGIGRDTNQELELGVRGPEPQERDQNGQDDGAHWIDPPAQLASQHARQETKAVDEEVIAMVFPQNSNL